MYPDFLKQYAPDILAQLTGKGVFLTAGREPANAMTIGWGSLGMYWGKPVFIAPVRLSRHTYGLIEASGCFSVDIPLHDMARELAYCGSRSGRDEDKLAALNLTAAPARSIPGSILADCELHLECAVRYSQTMDPGLLGQPASGKWYADRDMHRMFYGEIVDAYRT